MSKIAYVNGIFVPQNHAMVKMEDRGYQFGDGAYEVIYFKGPHFVDIVPHVERLYRSLQALQIQFDTSAQALILKIKELVRKNKYVEGFIYLQVTRGISPRDHIYPKGLTAILTMSVKKMTYQHSQGAEVFTEPDIRWHRNDIKSIALLGNVLTKNAAAKQKGIEAWLIDEAGYVTEGSASNSWIVDKNQTVVTTPVSEQILCGITRQRVLKFLAQQGMKFEERKFTLSEAHESTEAFITSSTKAVVPICKINGKKVGTGTVGPVVRKLQDLYLDFINNPSN